MTAKAVLEQAEGPTEEELLSFMVGDGLDGICRVQARGARLLPKQLHGYDTADFRTAALGAFVELGELVNECEWKPWRQYPDRLSGEQRAKIVDEAGDVLHFIAWMMNNLRARYGITSEDFAAGFMLAHRKNMARFNGEVPGREPPIEGCSGPYPGAVCSLHNVVH